MKALLLFDGGKMKSVVILALVFIFIGINGKEGGVRWTYVLTFSSSSGLRFTTIKRIEVKRGIPLSSVTCDPPTWSIPMIMKERKKRKI